MENLNIIEINDTHREEVINIFKNTFGESQWNGWLELELKEAVFNGNSYYKIDLYGIVINGSIVSVAGIADGMFLDSIKTLRLGATLPEFTKRGFMDTLVQYRLNLLKAKGYAGVLVSTMFPHRYTKYGFSLIQSSDSYKALYLDMENLNISHISNVRKII